MGKKKSLASLFITASLSVGLGGLACAQSADTEEGEQAEFKLPDVTVTATRRVASMQDVPVAVTSVDQTVLERNQVTNLVDIGNVAPNTVVARNPSSSSTSMIYIRGIGDDSSGLLTETPVSQYIDNVYVGRNVGALFDLIGIERVEILRGPQGTLYGRNSTGGAIKVVTTRPDTEEFSVRGDYTAGSFTRRDFRAMVNIPLADNLAANFSAGSYTNDGYYTDVSTGKGLNRQDVQAVRGGVLWDAADRLSFYLSADYTNDDSGLQVPTQMVGSSGAAMDMPLYGDVFLADPDVEDRGTVDTYGVALQTNYQLDKGMLEFTTAFRALDFNGNYDYGGAPIGADLIRDTEQKQISQEIQFSSDFEGDFNFVAGLYYFYEEGSGYEGFILGPGFGPIDFGFDIESQSIAAYAEGTYDFTDSFRVIAGGRLTRDDKKIERRGILAPTEGDNDWTEFTPKIGFQADLNPDMMAYATFSQGYKAGVYLIFPANPVQAATALEPEGVDAYEIGLKADWFDGRLRTNISAFYNEYSNIQIGVLGDSAGVEAVSADKEARGVELELTARPTENLFIFSNATLMDSEFTRVPTGSATYPELGDRQRFTPESSFKIGGEYLVPLQNGSWLTFGATYSWQDEQAEGFPNRLNIQDAYDLLDARIAYTPENERWGIELLGRNLGDTEYWTYQSYLAGYARYYNPGATWAVRLKFDF